MLLKKIKENFVYIFITNNIRPKSLKILVLLLTIDFYFLFNALMFNESFIKDLYNSKDDSFFGFIFRSFEHIIYVSIITKLIKELIFCFFYEERKIKGIFLRGKNKPNKIKMDIVNFIKKMEKYNKYFIILSYIITTISWFYISCFNNVYYYSKIEWIKSSIFCFLLIEIIISILIFLIESILRFLAIYYKNEKLFKWSKKIE